MFCRMVGSVDLTADLVADALNVSVDIAKLRAVYDQYGMEGLKYGIPSRPGTVCNGDHSIFCG